MNATTVLALIPNDVVKIETPVTQHCCLIVAETRRFSGLPHCPLVDFVLVKNPPETTPMRLRILSSQGANGLVTHRHLFLALYDSFSFDEGLLTVVQDKTKRLVIGDGSNPKKFTHDEFWRIGDRDGSQICQVVVCSQTEEPKEATIEFWDFSRLIDFEGIETEEFVFVELNKDSGWFEIWRGIEVAPGKIAVL